MTYTCSGWYSSLLSSLYHSSNALANNNNILEGEAVKSEESKDEDEEENDVRPHQGENQEKNIPSKISITGRPRRPSGGTGGKSAATTEVT